MTMYTARQDRFLELQFIVSFETSI